MRVIILVKTRQDAPLASHYFNSDVEKFSVSAVIHEFASFSHDAHTW